MTTQTVTGAVQEQSKDLKLINWLRAQQDDLAMAAASHLKPATIIRVAQGALRKDPKLMAAAIANPQSLIHCLLDAARLGHEAGTDQYWLIPFGNEVTGIEGYKGVIERMYRAGGVSTVHAEVVRQHDAYRSLGSRTPPVHEYDDFADDEERGALRGVYAYAIMADGSCSQVIRMGRSEVMKHKAMSRGSDRSDSPWKKWEPAMWKKGPLSGLEPYVPTSSEWLMSRARAEATAQGHAVIAPGWAPPAVAQMAVPAPLQITPGEVIATPDASPAGPDAPQSEPPVPPAETAPAGEAGHPDAAPDKQVTRLRMLLDNLGYTGDRDGRLRATEKLANRTRFSLTTSSALSREQCALAVRRVQNLPDAAALAALLDELAGDPREETDGE